MTECLEYLKSAAFNPYFNNDSSINNDWWKERNENSIEEIKDKIQHKKT